MAAGYRGCNNPVIFDVMARGVIIVLLPRALLHDILASRLNSYALAKTIIGHDQGY